MNRKLFIYQLLPRLFGNMNSSLTVNGTIEENGSGKFNDISSNVLDKLKSDGYTHVWYIGVLAHASTTDYTQFGIPHEFPEIIKGKAGSPYAVRDYYDVDPDLAIDVKSRMAEFEELVARTHAAGLKVIIDNIPNHVARNYLSVTLPKGVNGFGYSDDTTVSFSPKNNFYYLPGVSLDMQLIHDESSPSAYNEFPAKATGNDCFSHRPTRNDWYETVKLNYGIDYMNGMNTHFDTIPSTWLKMRDILLYWADKKVDGFRCDMAEMVPLAFWKWAIPLVKKKFPDIIFLAEIYNPSVYRDFLSENTFDYLYDKVGLYDVLRDVSCGFRPSSDITFALQNVGDIQHKMLNFLENHDEQRLASDFFLKEGNKGKAALVVSCCVNTNPVMIYAGQEFGEKGMDMEGFSGRDGRTSIFDYWSVDTIRRWNNHGEWNDSLLTQEEKNLQNFHRKLITLCNNESALSNGLFYNLMSANYENQEFDSSRLFAFLRSDGTDLLLVVANFDNNDQDCTIHIPSAVFDFFEIESGRKGVLEPLLTNDGQSYQYSHNYTAKIALPSFGGEIFKFSFQ